MLGILVFVVSRCTCFGFVMVISCLFALDGVSLVLGVYCKCGWRVCFGLHVLFSVCFCVGFGLTLLFLFWVYELIVGFTVWFGLWVCGLPEGLVSLRCCLICGFDSWLASLLLFYCCEFGILLCVNCVLISVVS